MSQDQEKKAPVADTAESVSSAPSQLVQFRDMVASMPYQQQVEALQPDMPVMFNRATIASHGSAHDVQFGGKDGEDDKDGEEELTTAKAAEYARALEVSFAAVAGTTGGSPEGAQALIDAAIALVKANSDAFLANMKGLQKEAVLLIDKANQYEEIVAQLMGTPPLNHKGESNLGVAGAVGPEKVYQHLMEGKGNVRTKMTALYNFMRPLSAAVLAARKSGDDTFFTNAGKQFEDLIGYADAAIQKAKDDGKRASLLGDAKSKTTKDHYGTARAANPDGGASTRKANDKSIGPELDKDELEFMGIKPGEVSSKTVTWKEGIDQWLMQEDDQWVKDQTELGLPIGGGPSGTTDRFMQTGDHLGCDAQGTRAAMIGYLLPINAHTLVEILTSAKPYGNFTEPIDSHKMYRNIKGYGSLQSHDKSPEQIFWKQAVMKE